MPTNKKQLWIGFDLGGTKMMAAAFDANFRVVGSCRQKMKDFRGQQAGLAGIVATIDRALAEAGRPRASAIGIGCPGVLDLNRGVILQSPNLGWRQVPLRRFLKKRYGCPVAVGNDVDVGTYGEFRFGAGRGARCVVGVFPGTGIGGACIYEGQILRGRVNSCMEIGHVHLQSKGRLCGCGRRGCLETVASRLAIAAEAAAAAYRGDAPRLLARAGTDLTAIRSGALAAAIGAGDAAVRDIVQHAAKNLGVAIASVVNLLAPDVVVLGGGLVEAMPAVFLDGVRHAIRKQAMKPFQHSVRVVRAQLGDDAVVRGAAALAAEPVHGSR